nr:MAG TPA: hypothetical protein [Bacteriophage sp.]
MLRIVLKKEDSRILRSFCINRRTILSFSIRKRKWNVFLSLPVRMKLRP